MRCVVARIYRTTPLSKGPAMNLADNLLRTAGRFPERPAVRLDDTVLT
jgi:hypothetical protein